MLGHDQQLCVIHAREELATDRAEQLDRAGYAEPGRLLGDKADFSLFERFQEIVIHAGIDQLRDQVGDGLSVAGLGWPCLECREDCVRFLTKRL